MADAKLWSTIDRIATLTDTLMVGAPGKDVAADSSNTTESTQESRIETKKQEYQIILQTANSKITEIQRRMESVKNQPDTFLTPEDTANILDLLQDKITQLQSLAQKIEAKLAS